MIHRFISRFALTSVVGFAMLSGSANVAGAQTSAAAPSPATTAAAVAPAAGRLPSGNANYRIHPGDSLAITIFNEPTLTQPAVRVDPGGTIEEPLAGAVRVAGLTTSQASDRIAHSLLKYVRHPQVSVAVSLVGPMDVFVLGNVKTPGKYELQPDSRLMDALAAAGGLGPVDGPMPDARLTIGDQAQSVSLQKLLHEGDLKLNVPLQNQTTVYVPSPTTFVVEVNGAVDHPGDVMLHEGDGVLSAIARAGSSPGARSDLNRVIVRHTLIDGTVQTQTVNLYDIIKPGAKDVTLAKGDIVYVPQGRGPGDNGPLTTIFYALTRFIP